MFHIVTSMEDWILRSTKMETVFVFFTRKTCAPCHIMEKIIKELKISLTLLLVDCDTFPEIPSRYYIKSTPTLCSWHGGRVWNQYNKGNKPADIEEFILKEIK